MPRPAARHPTPAPSFTISLSFQQLRRNNGPQAIWRKSFAFSIPLKYVSTWKPTGGSREFAAPRRPYGADLNPYSASTFWPSGLNTYAMNAFASPVLPPATGAIG